MLHYKTIKNFKLVQFQPSYSQEIFKRLLVFHKKMVNNKQFINCKERFLIRKHVSSQMLRKAKSRALFWL